MLTNGDRLLHRHLGAACEHPSFSCGALFPHLPDRIEAQRQVAVRKPPQAIGLAPARPRQR